MAKKNKKIKRPIIPRKYAPLFLFLLISFLIIFALSMRLSKDKYAANPIYQNIDGNYIASDEITIPTDGRIPKINLYQVAVEKLNYARATNKNVWLGFIDSQEYTGAVYTMENAVINVNDSTDLAVGFKNDSSNPGNYWYPLNSPESRNGPAITTASLVVLGHYTNDWGGYQTRRSAVAYNFGNFTGQIDTASLNIGAVGYITDNSIPTGRSFHVVVFTSDFEPQNNGMAYNVKESDFPLIYNSIGRAIYRPWVKITMRMGKTLTSIWCDHIPGGMNLYENGRFADTLSATNDSTTKEIVVASGSTVRIDASSFSASGFLFDHFYNSLSGRDDNTTTTITNVRADFDATSYFRAVGIQNISSGTITPLGLGKINYDISGGIFYQLLPAGDQVPRHQDQRIQFEATPGNHFESGELVYPGSGNSNCSSGFCRDIILPSTCTITGDITECKINDINKDYIINATFAPNTCEVSANIPTGNGAVNYNPGTGTTTMSPNPKSNLRVPFTGIASFTIAPADGYKIDKIWRSINGLNPYMVEVTGIATPDLPYNFMGCDCRWPRVADSSCSITAEFTSISVPPPVTNSVRATPGIKSASDISTISGEHGKVYPTTIPTTYIDTMPIAIGKDIEYVVVPDIGYEIASVTDNGTPVAIGSLTTYGANKSYRIPVVNTPHDIIVTFSPISNPPPPPPTQDIKPVIYIIKNPDGSILKQNYGYPTGEDVVTGSSYLFDFVPISPYHGISSIVDNGFSFEPKLNTNDCTLQPDNITYICRLNSVNHAHDITINLRKAIFGSALPTQQESPASSPATQTSVNTNSTANDALNSNSIPNNESLSEDNNQSSTMANALNKTINTPSSSINGDPNSKLTLLDFYRGWWGLIELATDSFFNQLRDLLTI